MNERSKSGSHVQVPGSVLAGAFITFSFLSKVHFLSPLTFPFDLSFKT